MPAEELAHDLDLSWLLQKISRIEGLLERQNDAPVIRLIIGVMACTAAVT